MRPWPSRWWRWRWPRRSEEHTSELQSQSNLVCRLLLEKKKNLITPAADAPEYAFLNRTVLCFQFREPRLARALSKYKEFHAQRTMEQDLFAACTCRALRAH